MTTIALLGASRSMPNDIERALVGDDVIRVERAEALDGVEQAEIAIAAGRARELLRAFLARAPRLRWLHVTSAGVNLALPELRERPGLTVTNNSGSYNIQVSEFALALILAAAKRLPDYQRAQQSSQWDRSPESADLRDSRLVVLGLGSIGSEVARLAAAFGMRVVGVRRRPDGPAVPGVERVVGPDRLPEVVSDADFLAITAPLTAATRGIVSRDVLARMKPTVWIVNVARGEIVDETALLEALQAGRIAGAAIDTWWLEPLPSTSPWWHLPNVIATPHAASSSPRLKERTRDLFLENLRRWKAGESLLNVVDTTEGY